MSLGTLWTIPRQPPGRGIRAAAAYADLKIDLPSSYTHFESNKRPEFLNKFPQGKIPAWEGNDGFLLFEAVAVAQYVSSLAPHSTLLGSSPQEEALIIQWLSFAVTEIHQYSRLIRFLISGEIAPYSKSVHTYASEAHARSFQTLNEHLSHRSFLVGEGLTVADFFVAAILQPTFGTTFDKASRIKYPNVVRFFETVVNQPKVKEIYGETEYVEEAIQYEQNKDGEEKK